jgi:hypothetical protein
VAGNPELAQEESWRYNVNLDYRLPNDGGVLSSRFFYFDNRNAIGKIDVSPNPQTLVSTNGNVGDGKIFGLYLNASIRLGFLNLPQAVIRRGGSRREHDHRLGDVTRFGERIRGTARRDGSRELAERDRTDVRNRIDLLEAIELVVVLGTRQAVRTVSVRGEPARGACVNSGGLEIGRADATVQQLEDLLGLALARLIAVGLAAEPEIVDAVRGRLGVDAAEQDGEADHREVTHCVVSEQAARHRICPGSRASTAVPATRVVGKACACGEWSC